MVSYGIWWRWLMPRILKLWLIRALFFCRIVNKRRNRWGIGAVTYARASDQTVLCIRPIFRRHVRSEHSPPYVSHLLRSSCNLDVMVFIYCVVDKLIRAWEWLDIRRPLKECEIAQPCGLFVEWVFQKGALEKQNYGLRFAYVLVSIQIFFLFINKH